METNLSEKKTLEDQYEVAQNDSDLSRVENVH